MVLNHHMEITGCISFDRKHQEYSLDMACRYIAAPPRVLHLTRLSQMRIVNAFRFCLRTQRPKVPVTHEQLFRPLITTTHAPLMEIDFNLHSMSLLPPSRNPADINMKKRTRLTSQTSTSLARILYAPSSPLASNTCVAGQLP